MNKIFFITLVCVIFIACKDNKSNERIESGCIKGDCQNGYGTIRYANGGTATGDFVNGTLNGYGEIVWGKGKFEGDTLKGNFIDGIAKGNVTMYKARIDATFVGITNGKYDLVSNIDGNDPATGHFKVYFGENSLWEGTFEGDFRNGTSKEWEERISINHAKEGKYVAKNASLFLSAIYCFYQIEAFKNTNEPLSRIYTKNLTTEIVSNKEIKELADSIESQKKILAYSISRLNQVEEFDKKIPLKAVLCEQLNQILIGIDEYMPQILEMLAEPPSKKKLQDIYDYNKSFDKKLEKMKNKHLKTYQKFENKYIVFYNN